MGGSKALLLLLLLLLLLDWRSLTRRRACSAQIRQAVGSASGGDSLRPAAAAAGTLRSLREIAGAAARAGGGAEEGGAAHWRAAVPAAVASAALGFLFLYTSVVLARRGADAEAPLALGLDVVVRSELPVGAGMGSSGSYCVAVAAALLAAARVCPLPLTTADGVPDDATRHLINGWAFRAEGIFHGTPSGIDNTVRRATTPALRRPAPVLPLTPSLPWSRSRASAAACASAVYPRAATTPSSCRRCRC